MHKHHLTSKNAGGSDDPRKVLKDEDLGNIFNLDYKIES